MANTKIYWLKFGSGDARTYTGLAPTFLQFYDGTGQTYAPPSISEIKYGGVTASGIYGFTYGIGTSTQNSIYFLAFSATTLSNASDNYITGVLDPLLITDIYALGISTNLANQGSTLVGVGNTLTTRAVGATLTAIGSSISVLSLGTSLVAQGATQIAIGNTILAIGSSISVLAFGSTLVAMGQTLVAIGNTTGSIGTSLTVEVAGIGSTMDSFGTSGQDPSSVFGYLKRIQELLEGDQVFTASSGIWQMYNRTAFLGVTTLLRTKTITNPGPAVTKYGV